MKQHIESFLGRSLVSGTVAGLATAVTAALAGRKDTASYAAPLNATSHVVWGDTVALQDRASLKYTLTGFLLNHAATIFWASIYEKWLASRPHSSRTSPWRPLIGAAALTAGAYVTDYYLVPKRFTPGFEKRVSGQSLAAIFGVLAISLAARAMLGRAADIFVALRLCKQAF